MLRKHFAYVDYAELGNLQGVPLALHPWTIELYVLYERANDHSMGVDRILCLAREKRIGCYSAEFGIGIKLFSNRLEGSEPQEQFVREVDVNRATRNFEVVDLAPKNGDLRLRVVVLAS